MDLSLIPVRLLNTNRRPSALTQLMDVDPNADTNLASALSRILSRSLSQCV